MKVTNNLNLPEPLVRAVMLRGDREYKPNTISVTGLIRPPQMRGLAVKHGGELTEDASERIFALLGQLMAEALATHAENLLGHLAEEQMEMTVLGWQVTGRYDLASSVLDEEILTDYKLTSVYALKDGIKTEFEQQLNLYKYLIESTTKRVISALQIVGVYRDWSKLKARYSSDYPKVQVETFNAPIWGTAEVKDFLEERVRLHQKAEQGEWPDCTPEERWAKPTIFAVMKQGRKRAVKLYESKELADRHASNAPAHFVVKRPSQSTRCESYCSVSSVCSQWAKIQKETEEPSYIEAAK